jgi:hypothetical protein
MLIMFIDTNRGPERRFIMTSSFYCTLQQDKLEAEYMALSTNGQMIMDPIYGQISFHCCLSKACQFQHGHNPIIY